MKQKAVREWSSREWHAIQRAKDRLTDAVDRGGVIISQTELLVGLPHVLELNTAEHCVVPVIARGGVRSQSTHTQSARHPGQMAPPAP